MQRYDIVFGVLALIVVLGFGSTRAEFRDIRTEVLDLRAEFRNNHDDGRQPTAAQRTFLAFVAPQGSWTVV